MESQNYLFTVARESELDELLVGKEAGASVPWSRLSSRSQRYVAAGCVGVLWKRGDHPGDPVQPLVLVSPEQDIRRLCGRYAQLRSDLSPLTAWCHLLTPQLFESLEALTRDPELGGLQAAWTGLVIAEALLLSERPLASLRVPACFATQTFAIGRAKALWPQVVAAEVAKRFDAANRLFRNGSVSQRGELRTEKVRSALEPIWASLAGVPADDRAPDATELRPLVASLQALQRARSQADAKESSRLAKPLLDYVPEAQGFMQLAELTPEHRLRLFDELVESLDSATAEREPLRRNALALLTGYLATVAAGGAPSLSLAESIAQRWPEITAWAYAAGGIGERVVWTSSFDGLGRLVARELMRPLRLDEPPTCDFAFDEGAVLADPKLPDPLVHLRVKQARLATVALLPGVNTSIPVTAHETGKPEPARAGAQIAPPAVIPARPNARAALAVLADALWPYIRDRVADYTERRQDDSATLRNSGESERPRGKPRPDPQTDLPLTNPKK